MAPPFASMATIPHCGTVCISVMISDIALPFQLRGLVARCAAVFQFPLHTASCMHVHRCGMNSTVMRNELDRVWSIPFQHVTMRCIRQMSLQCMEGEVLTHHCLRSALPRCTSWMTVRTATSYRSACHVRNGWQGW